jgi:hypothetical protein
MRLNERQVEELRQWADTFFNMQAPVRLEIAAESHEYTVHSTYTGSGCAICGKDEAAHNPMARVYLREPRCYGHGTQHDVACECGPLAEKRLA